MTLLRRLLGPLKKVVNPGPAEPPYVHVCQVGDPVLREECVGIPEEDYCAPYVQAMVNHMKKVMETYKLVGLSICQIGIPLRIIGLNLTESRKTDLTDSSLKALPSMTSSLLIILNPELRVTDYDQLLKLESCASVKGYSAVVSRYAAVDLSGIMEGGAPVTLSASGLLARVIQHEMDHLDGKLYLDKMDVTSFQNDGWQRINAFAGNVFIHFKPEK